MALVSAGLAVRFLSPEKSHKKLPSPTGAQVFCLGGNPVGSCEAQGTPEAGGTLGFTPLPIQESSIGCIISNNVKIVS